MLPRAMWALAWGLSLASLSQAFSGARWIAPTPSSLVALCLLPWLAFAGAPGLARRFEPWLWPLGALVPLAIASALELRAGTAAGALASHALAGLALIALLSQASARADGGGAGRGRWRAASYASAWFLLVPAAIAWRLAQRDGALAPAPGPSWLHASPLELGLRGWATTVPDGVAWPWGPTLVAVILFALAAVPIGGAADDPSPP